MGDGGYHQLNHCCRMFPARPVTLCFVKDFGVTVAGERETVRTARRDP